MECGNEDDDDDCFVSLDKDNEPEEDDDDDDCFASFDTGSGAEADDDDDCFGSVLIRFNALRLVRAMIPIQQTNQQ